MLISSALQPYSTFAEVGRRNPNSNGLPISVPLSYFLPIPQFYYEQDPKAAKMKRIA